MLSFCKTLVQEVVQAVLLGCWPNASRDVKPCAANVGWWGPFYKESDIFVSVFLPYDRWECCSGFRFQKSFLLVRLLNVRRSCNRNILLFSTQRYIYTCTSTMLLPSGLRSGNGQKSFMFDLLIQQQPFPLPSWLAWPCGRGPLSPPFPKSFAWQFLWPLGYRNAPSSSRRLTCLCQRWFSTRDL